MAGNMALLAGLLMFICVQAVTMGTSPTVPDGVVYTEVKKTLVRGLQGKLTCRFYGEPWAVYWKRGYDPMDLDLMLVWHTGDVSGPRYDDSSCDIDDTFSLIIHNVSMTDAGRIYCIVSNYQGILLENYTDISVTDTAIDTKAQVILEMGPGRVGILQCTVHIKARRVSWRKITSLTNESLVVLENNNNDAEISGLGYKKDMYNITEHYSLVIKNPQVRQEGLYVCEVTDFDTGMSFRNHTFVSVIAQPLKPFPTIQECMNIEQFDSHYCSLDATSEITLTCQVMEYYPKVNLFFLHGSKVVDPFEKMEWNNTDGTKNKTVKIAARESKELYTCVASQIPGFNERMSTSVLLHPVHDDGTFNSALVVVLVCFAAVILLSSMAYFVWRKRRRHSDNDYTPVTPGELHVKDVKDLTEEEQQALLKCVDDAFMQHYRRIYDLIDTLSTLDTEEIIKENKIALFDIEQMLNEWQQNPESTFCSYMKTMQIFTSKEEKSDHAWPSDEELRWISRHLRQESMTEICNKLKITIKTEDNDDEEKKFDGLCKWRNKMAHVHLEKKHNQLSSATRSKTLRGLLPPLIKGRFIYKAELVDMAFNLLIQDLLPVTGIMKINATKLLSYRPAFQPFHLQMGTINLLSELLSAVNDECQEILEKNMRSLFFTKIGKLTYRNVATCGMVAYDMSYGELCAITAAMASTIERASDSQVHDTDAMEHRTSTRGVEISEDLVDLLSVLRLTDQDIADGLGPSHPITAYALLKIWKEKPRPSVFNYRAAFAYELRGIQMPDLADEVIAGKYITEQTNLEFIQNTVQGLSEYQLRSLGELLGLSREDEERSTCTPFHDISIQICEWVANWTKQMRSWYIFTETWNSFREVSRYDYTIPQKHRDLNDKLVENGFLDLAREIMIIEQQIVKANVMES